MTLMGSVVARSAKLAMKLAQSHLEGAMTYKVRIARGGAGTPGWDPVANRVTNPDDDEVYVGPARIRSVTGPVTMALGDEPQYFQSTFASIPLSARVPQTDDLLTVLDGPDPKLVGRSYRVVDVERGGMLPVAHVMQLVGIEPGHTWSP